MLDDSSGSWLWNGWLASSWPDSSAEKWRCVLRKFLNFFFHSLILCELLQNGLVSAIITGVYCCGPAPVKAIKNKRVDLFYDVPFVYASVNADIHTIILGQGQVLGFSKDTERVGSLICTKAVGFPRLQKITGDYKYIKSMTIKLEFCSLICTLCNLIKWYIELKW